MVLAVSAVLALSSPHFITLRTLWLCWECKETWVLTLTSRLKLQSTGKRFVLVSLFTLTNPSSKTSDDLSVWFFWILAKRDFVLFVGAAGPDNSELCWLVSESHVWPEAYTLQAIMSQLQQSNRDLDRVMGDRGFRSSVKMTRVLLSHTNVLLVRGQ